MNLDVFLQTMLPTTGLKIVTVSRPPGEGWPTYRVKSIATMVRVIKDLDSKGENVFYALGGYAPVDAQSGLKTRRKAYNVVAMRCFFVDLDVGVDEPGKRPKYRTQKEAGQAMLAFARAVGLVAPSLASSGVGLHAYWPINEDMDPALWQSAAEALKRALTQHGVRFDPARTADAASVLRPVGAHHRKDPSNPLPVKLLFAGPTMTVDAFLAAMFPWVQAAATGPAPITGAKLSAANAALGGGMGYDPSSALQIADQCGVIALIRDTRGKVEEPLWYNALGVLLHTEEAPDICHEWSKGDPRYDPKQVDDKLTQLGNHGATTCERLASHRPDICKTCPFNGHITSPIQLGRGKYTPPPPQQATPQAAAGGGGKGAFGGGTTAGSPASAGGGSSNPSDPPMPSNAYRSILKGNRRVLEGWAPKTDKKPGEWVVISRTVFWATRRLDNSGTVVEWVREEHDGSHVIFNLPGTTIGKGGNEALGALGGQGISAARGQRDALVNYLNRWMDRVNEAPMVDTHPSFGWSKGCFITGDVAIAADGSETPPVLIGDAARQQATVACKGSLDAWKHVVDRAYHAPGQEAFQFQLLCSFAAPLLSLTQQVRGLTVYSHSAGSGVGKTTVQRVALSAWGDWEQMMLAQGKATVNSLWLLLGVYGTLPVVYDELTNARNDEASELVYSVSSGRAKMRATQAGTLNTNNSNWSTILLASGNSLLSDKLAGHRGEPDAEISRLFEFTQNSKPHLTVQEANDLFPLIDSNYGHAGLVYARYLVRHRAKIMAYLKDVQRAVVDEFEITQAERYWSSLFTCVLAARTFCARLGLFDFEVGALKVWMHEQLEDNRGVKEAAVASPEEHLSQMINDLSQHVLITSEVGNMRRNNVATIVENGFPRSGKIRGRMIRDPNRETLLWLARPDIHDWCRERGVSHKELHRAGVSNGWVDADTKQQKRLGTGTDHETAPVICWKFYPDRMPLASGFKVIQGGNVQSLTGKP